MNKEALTLNTRCTRKTRLLPLRVNALSPSAVNDGAPRAVLVGPDLIGEAVVRSHLRLLIAYLQAMQQ